jgi:uncharacterized hydantoinase/oxoprolinase family protein
LNDGSNTAIDIIPIVDEESVQRSKRDVEPSESSEVVNERALEYDSYANKHALRKRSIENKGAYSFMDIQSDNDYIVVNSKSKNLHIIYTFNFVFVLQCVLY